MEGAQAARLHEECHDARTRWAGAGPAWPERPGERQGKGHWKRPPLYWSRDGAQAKPRAFPSEFRALTELSRERIFRNDRLRTAGAPGGGPDRDPHQRADALDE